ncbi:MAG: hypothetical protein ACE5FU_07770, partial [Nitrospinota bacterium]
MKEESVAKLILTKYTGDSAELLQFFLRAFLQKIPPAYRRLFKENELANFILARFYTFVEITETNSSVEIHTGKEDDPVFSRRALVDIAVTNGPFVVETTHSYFSFNKLSRILGIHFTLDLSSKGKPEEVSYSFYALEPINKENLKENEDFLRKSLDGVKIVTKSFGKILSSIDRTASLLAGEKSSTETINCIRWMRGNNFIYMGTGRIHFPGKGNPPQFVGGDETGLLAAESGLQEKFLSCLSVEGKKPISFIVTNEISFVHRFENIILVRVRLPNPGEEFIMTGNFSSAAKRLEFATIPVIREKVKWLLDERGYVTNSYDYKHECTLLQKIPLEEFFSLPSDTLEEITAFLNGISGGEALEFHLHTNISHKLFVGIITLTEDMFTPTLFSSIKNVFDKELKRPFRSYKNSLNNERIILHFYSSIGEVPEIDTERVESKIREICKSWESRIVEQVHAVSGGEKSS